MPEAPVACRWLIRIASWIVLRRLRPQWRHERERRVFHWWAFLAEHGDYYPGSRTDLLAVGAAERQPNGSGNR